MMMTYKEADNVKVSNKLISAVLGVECEFYETRYDDELIFTSKNTNWSEKVNSVNCHVKGFVSGMLRINLNSFAKLGKIWAYNNKYLIQQNSKTSYVFFEAENIPIEKQTFDEYAYSNDPFDVREMLNCLEWILKELK